MQTLFGVFLRASNLYEQRIDERLAELGLRAQQLPVMMLASEPGGVLIDDVRRTTGLRKSTLSSLISRLERAGYLRKRADMNDGRFRTIEATIPGAQATQIATEILSDLEDRLTQTLDGKDWRDLAVLFDVADAIAHLPMAQLDPTNRLPEDTV